MDSYAYGHIKFSLPGRRGKVLDHFCYVAVDLNNLGKEMQAVGRSWALLSHVPHEFSGHALCPPSLPLEIHHYDLLTWLSPQHL